MTRLVSILILVLVSGTAAAQLLDDSVSDEELLARFRSGGLVLVFRHGETGPNPDRDDLIAGTARYAGSASEKQAAYSDCERQRMLSVEGRQEMIAVARSMQQIGVLIGDVIASPLCRTRETAWLLAGQVIASEALIGAPNHARMNFVTSEPAAGSNRILVSHSYVVAGLFGEFDLMTGHRLAPRGHAFVLDPDGKGGFTLLARLSPEDWARLAGSAVQ